MNINLSKKQTINLSKQSDKPSLEKVLFGLNWGMITTAGSKGFFGFGKSEGTKKSVDLDASVTCFSSTGRKMDTIYFGKLSNSYIKHSGDDRVGDEDADDNDNETITVDLSKVPSEVAEMYFYMNSFSGEKFDEIPYAGLRIYEGVVDRPSNVMATFDVANDSSFKGSKTIIIGKLFRNEGEWDFEAIGDAKPYSRINDTISDIQNNYL